MSRTTYYVLSFFADNTRYTQPRHRGLVTQRCYCSPPPPRVRASALLESPRPCLILPFPGPSPWDALNPVGQRPTASTGKCTCLQIQAVAYAPSSSVRRPAKHMNICDHTSAVVDKPHRSSIRLHTGNAEGAAAESMPLRSRSIRRPAMRPSGAHPNPPPRRSN